VAARRPAGASGAYRLDASATGSSAQVFGSFVLGAGPGVATWVTTVSPGLSLFASPTTLRRGNRTTIDFKVTDAGDPVRGATVRAGGKSDTTDNGGKASLSLTPSGRRLSVKASAPGYTAAARKLRVRR
jgi:hypothetical protein